MKRQKYGGRTAGTPNRLTIEIRNVLNSFIEANKDQIQPIFDELDNKDKLKFIVEVLPYITPKYQSTQLTIEEPTEPIVVRIDKSNLYEFPSNTE